jgi:uncharacterized repeat protein (TIGR01451 family)
MVVLSILCVILPFNSLAMSEGDMGVFVISGDLNAYFGVAAGDTLHYTMVYFWIGNGTAPNTKVTFQPPAGLEMISESVAPSSRAGGILTWNVGTLENYASQTIEMAGIVRSGIVEGEELKAVARVSGDVKDTDLTNNVSELVVKSVKKRPDLFLWKMGKMEMLYDSEGFYFTSEEGSPTEYSIVYMNFGVGEAPDVLIKDELPEGFTFASAEPPPTRVSGNSVEWELGKLPMWGSGEITLRVVPRQSGVFTTRTVISTSAQEGSFDGGSEEMPNESEFTLRVVSLLPPVITQPATSNFGGEFTTTPNPRIEGFAKVGATITMYEGPEGYFSTDVSGLTPVGTATAGSDRIWKMPADALAESREYFLYFRAEKDGKVSAISPALHLKINAALAKAGFDMDGFSVASGGNETNPGGLGGSTGTVPNEDVIITLRQAAPHDFDTNTGLWEYHRLNITIDDHGRITEDTVPVFRVERVGSTEKKSESSSSIWDIVYKIPGLGPSIKVFVEFKPVEYDPETEEPKYVDEDGDGDDDSILITEILIDPAGYVYDLETAGREYTWPEVPPDNSLIEQATVTAYVRTGDQEWDAWDAPRYDQVNPQVTDTATEDKVKQKGYYAFFVPSGQYRVVAQAPRFTEYESPILTVVNEPIYHNVGMRAIKEVQTAVREARGTVELPKAVTVVRNYPNPFNPSTTIFFVLPAKGQTTLTIYNMNGQKVRELLAKDLPAGAHTILWDGRNSEGQTVSSGVYFSVLKAGRFFGSSRMMMLK